MISFRRLCTSLSVFLAISAVTPPGLQSQPGEAQALPAPPVTGVLGVKDAAAVEEIAAFMQASSSTGWHDLEASGMLTFPSGDQHAATLWLVGDLESRLDIETDTGVRSVRLTKSSGRLRDERGNQVPFLPETSSRGILPLSKLWAGVAPSRDTSLHDQGLFTESGQNLHRITMEYPYIHEGGFHPTVSADLYFDPATHLLVLSVEDVRFVQSSYRLFRRVTSYSNYQAIGPIILPTTIQQTIDGQIQWTLQISQATTNTNPPDSTFSF
jgi:hypothetical protein